MNTFIFPRVRDYVWSISIWGGLIPRLLPASSPKRTMASGVPEDLSSLFWDTNWRQIHLRRHARYVIERVLELGWLDAVSWLQRVYPVQTIIDVLTVSKVITAKSRNFWKLWFGVKDA